MSVDASACLAYGWMVEHDKLTERFHKLNGDDFEELDGRFFGYGYASELVTQVDGYSDASPYHIGLPIEVERRIRDENGYVRAFEQLDASGFSDAVAAMSECDAELVELYRAVMGEEPPCGPKVDLFVEWW